MTSARFVTGPMGLLVARTAERFHQLPSTVLRFEEPLRALDLDIALALRLAKADRKPGADIGRPFGSIADGLVYEDPDAALAAELAERGINSPWRRVH